MDRLIEAIASVGNPSVVGLDPKPELLPKQLIDRAHADTAKTLDADGSTSELFAWTSSLATEYLRFNLTIIDAIADIVPAVKPQIAMYEALGVNGLLVYTATCRRAHDRGLYVLGDVKRGDIGSTAAAYAKHLSEHELWMEDAVTVNPYLGVDGITPFVDAAKEADADVFALVKTSNPSSDEIQNLTVADGSMVYEHVADLVEEWGVDSIGEHGYSRVGAVVGATHPREGRALRARMPHTFFLIPGYGAQGGTAADVAGMFDGHGSGAIVNSSRGIIASWRRSDRYSEDLGYDEALRVVAECARDSALSMRDDLNAALDR
ncbi:orotidine 5'-phosphate decarboxylase [Bifidobacterium margollesii]|uniref:Orotidine 5'-phosphate decarboxylase n=1 Tax=Bifidobacterium margollesii TaxID=2020964 RepID=A0A2N5J723_9BIFI|nr:orotidine-5'-phosphate decarboxylase [Bifidobacterium margollesii]PLS30008.1 orotidine 5'-phosphate decarboxylase [Bifidobacterium margollesii]